MATKRHEKAQKDGSFLVTFCASSWQVRTYSAIERNRAQNKAERPRICLRRSDVRMNVVLGVAARLCMPASAHWSHAKLRRSRRPIQTRKFEPLIHAKRAPDHRHNPPCRCGTGLQTRGFASGVAGRRPFSRPSRHGSPDRLRPPRSWVAQRTDSLSPPRSAHLPCRVMITTAVTITAAAASIGTVTASPASAQPSNTAITGLT